MHKKSEVASAAEKASLKEAATGKALEYKDEPAPPKRRKARSDGLQNDEADVVP